MKMTDEAQEKVRKVMDEKIRPGLQQDGGDAELVEITDEGVVRVRLTGACSGCPFAGLTLAHGVEATLKENVAEVVRVEPVQ